MIENSEVAANEVPAQPDDFVSADEEKARADGWVPQEEYEGNHWRSAEDYNDRGDMINSVRAAKKQAEEAQAHADKALERNNQFHHMQNEMQIKRIDDLERQLKDTVEVGDTAGFDRIQSQIKDEQQNFIPVPEPEAPPRVDVSEGTRLIEKWNAENPWISEHSPEASFAKAEFERYLQQNNTPGKDPNILVTGAIAQVEHAMGRQFPDESGVNENRHKPSKFSHGRMGSRGTRSLSMDDLTREEMGVWNSQKDAYKDPEEFLSIVANSRKGVA